MKYLRSFFTLIIAVVLSCPMNAKDPSSALVVKSTADAMVVFAKPTKMSKKKGSAALKDLEYDITALTLCDSISVTASVITATPLVLDSVSVESGVQCCKYSLERIFVEPKGKNWLSRIRFYIPMSDFVFLTSSDVAPILIFSPNSENAPAFEDKRSKWLERKQVYNLIINILNQNHEKN